MILQHFGIIQNPCTGSLEEEVEVNALRMKIIGKPYTGKPYVRFDEGKLEKCLWWLASFLLYPVFSIIFSSFVILST